MYHIYKITSPSEKIYIGFTSNIAKRTTSYKHLSCKSQTLLYNSLKKYGWEAHKFEIISSFENKNDAELCEIEQIYKYKLLKISLNIAYGGLGGVSRGKDNPLSKKVYQYNEKGKLIKIWDCLSDIERDLNIKVAEISSACRKKTYYCKNYFWCFIEDKDNITFERKIGKNGRAIYKLDQDFNIIDEFPTIKAACATNTDYYGVIDCLYMKYKLYKGFHWIHKDSLNEENMQIIRNLPERQKPKRSKDWKELNKIL